MKTPGHGSRDRWLRRGYWIVFAMLAVGAARTLLRLARHFGWI